MVTSGFAVWNAAIQACWAASCDDAPAPTRLPESDDAVSEGAEAPASFAAQELSAIAAVTAMTAGTPKRLRFT